MTDLNKRLHEALGVPYHKCGAACDAHHAMTGDSCDWELNQNLLAQVSIPCAECGGTGATYISENNHKCHKCPDYRPVADYGTVCRYLHEIEREGSQCQLPHQCPCQGLPRLITRLQQILEENGEWISFMEWLADKLHSDCHDMYDFIEVIEPYFTDANKLGMSYLEYKGR